jgi:Zn-dependent protease with chaperone function
VDGQPVRAHFFDGRSAAAREVTLALSGTGALAQLHVSGAGTEQLLLLEDASIGERVGAVHRLVGLPHGASLEVLDNARFDEALARCGVRTAEQGIGRLENYWRYALSAGICALAAVVLFLKFGLPVLSARAVALLPPVADAYIGADTLRVLDSSAFAPSALPAARQGQLTAEFAQITHDFPWPGTVPVLVFRTGGRLGANAIALPSGIVVLTDELVAKSKDDNELRGVLAHEVGHVAHRHAMRMLVQSSTSTLVMAGLFGDVSGAAPLTAAAPALLVNAAYSRDFEREADEFAFSWMNRHHIAPDELGALLERLGGKQAGGASFLASHPDIEERVRAAHARQQQSPPPKP